MTKTMEKPNESRLIKSDYNRVTNDNVWKIGVSALERCMMHDSEDVFRRVRKACVREREEWLAIKKTLRGPDAKMAKEFDREWLRRERAATLLINYNAGTQKGDWDPYYWPCELAPAIEYCLSEAFLEW